MVGGVEVERKWRRVDGMDVQRDSPGGEEGSSIAITLRHIIVF